MDYYASGTSPTTSLRAKKVNQDLVERAKRLMLLSPDSGRWNVQEQYGKPFYERRRRMTDADVRAHLHGTSWIGSRLPVDGYTDRIVFDIDAKYAEGCGQRDLVYRSVRDYIGRARRVLAWQTPSGLGLRLACRIPSIQMSELAKSDTQGLLPEALSGAGLEPRLGTLEIYPAAHRCDRQILGRRMPLIDPETLKPIVGADLGDAFDEQKLRRAIELVEEWHEEPDDDLVEHIRMKPRLSLPADAARGGPEPVLRRERAPRPGQEDRRLAQYGLWERNSRYVKEFQVGRNMWLWPHLFTDLGLPPDPTREDVAACLAVWLCERSNDMSADWNATLRRLGRETGIDHWKQTYLRLNQNDNRAPVDRMRLAAISVDPGMFPTVHLAPSEHDAILSISDHARRSRKLNTMEMYRFEVWACSLLRVAKRQIRREPWAATKRARVRAEIKAEWMAGWPWGKRYAYYRSIIAEAGLLKQVAQYRAPKPGVPGRAITYEFDQPDWIRRRDLPSTVDLVEDVVENFRISNRQATVDDAYHALHAAERGIDLVRRYGRETAKIPRNLLRVLRPPLIPVL